MKRKFLILPAISVLLIIVSCYFVDRQLVWYLQSVDSRAMYVMRYFANGIPTLIGAGIFLFYIYFALSLLKNMPSVMESKIVAICNAVVIGVFMKSVFKIIFGRYWTATFQCDNRSLLSNQIYGFNWFHTGFDYGSFPSGHATFICAFGFSIWYLFPKIRWLAVVLMVLVVGSQVGLYYHFVSDVIAGALLGYIVARCVVAYNSCKAMP